MQERKLFEEEGWKKGPELEERIKRTITEQARLILGKGDFVTGRSQEEWRKSGGEATDRNKKEPQFRSTTRKRIKRQALREGSEKVQNDLGLKRRHRFKKCCGKRTMGSGLSAGRGKARARKTKTKPVGGKREDREKKMGRQHVQPSQEIAAFQQHLSASEGIVQETAQCFRFLT